MESLQPIFPMLTNEIARTWWRGAMSQLSAAAVSFKSMGKAACKSASLQHPLKRPPTAIDLHHCVFVTTL